MREAINEGKEIKAQDEAEPEVVPAEISEEDQAKIVEEAVVEGEKEAPTKEA